MPLKQEARDPGPIEQTPTQIDNYLIRPEDFSIRQYFDPIREPFTGQSANDREAAKRSREEFNRGSVRAEGNVNHAGPPHKAFPSS